MKVVLTVEQLAYLQKQLKALHKIAVSKDGARSDGAKALATLSQKVDPAALFLNVNRNELRAIQSVIVRGMQALTAVMAEYDERPDAAEYKLRAEAKRALLTAALRSVEAKL